MKADLGDLNAFLAVAQARGFRDAARTSGVSASTLSEAVRRLETGDLDARMVHQLPGVGMGEDDRRAAGGDGAHERNA